MKAAFQNLNASIESRPAWQEALIVGTAVGLALALVDLARGQSLGEVVLAAVVGLVGSALGVWVGRPFRARRRARRLGSN